MKKYYYLFKVLAKVYYAVMIKRDVAVLILVKDNKILLQKRAKTAIRFPETWGLFGGGIEANETPEEGLEREIKEELGLNLNAYDLIDKVRYSIPEREESGFVYVFRAQYCGEKLSQNEGSDMGWFTFAECAKLKLMPIYKTILERISHKPHSVVL